MITNNLLTKLMGRVYRAADDGNGGDNGGGAEDRGDDFVPTGPDADKEAEAAAAAEAAKKAVIDPADVKKLGLEAGNTAAKEGGEDGKNPDDEEEDDKGDKDAKKGKGVIPVDRHEKILQREREARQRAEAALQQAARGREQVALNEKLAKYDAKIADLEQKQVKAVSDGDTEKALAIGRELRATERERNNEEAEFKTAVATANAVEAARYTTVVERLEEAYPVMNPDHADYDEEVVSDILALKAGYERQGMTPSAALQKATTRLLKPETRKQEDATTVTPRVDKEAIAAERKKGAVDKAVKTSKQQPADLKKMGENSDAKGGVLTAEKVMSMKQSEFDKLSEEQLSALRGDDFVPTA